MQRDIYRGHLFLLIVILLTMSSGLFDRFIPEFWYELIHQYLFLALPAFLYVILRKKDLNRTFRLNPITLRDVLMLVGITFIMQPAVYLLATVAEMIFGNQLEFLFADLQEQPFWYLVLSIAIAPAICEELVLRGVIMDAYRGQSLYTMVIMNGVLFGLFHMNINQFVYTFFMGTVLSLCVYYTNSIFSGMIIHFVNNLLSIYVLSFPDSMYARFEYWLFAIERPFDIIKFVVLGVISFMLTFRFVNRMGRNNRKRYLHEVTVISAENIVNWPLIVLGLLFVVLSIMLTMTVSNI